MICKICSKKSSYFGQAEILSKYSIKYYKCPDCGFIQTEEPYWLEEAYHSTINRTDVGYVYRNVLLSKVVKKIIFYFYSKTGKFLDYGGGYGLFVRLMRDIGYDFYWDDAYCENIFSKDFELKDVKEKKFELVTAFELCEHLVNPLEDFEKILKFSRNIFISTEVYPKTNPNLNEWWYFGLEHGQHVSIYSKETFEYLAKKYNLNFYTNGKNLHLLSSKKINSLFFKYISLYYIYISLRPFSSVKTLVNKDFDLVLNRIKSGN
ncbi:MAG TPA: class I SAM-dependent methyltransferase [Ignavibacteria bacterium]|nr:class I SAM-dependent methyltransferase [Ignavibacteria bacterium]